MDDYSPPHMFVKLTGCFCMAIASILIPVVIPLLASSGFCNSEVSTPQKITYSIVQQFPHDPEAFTQGLAWHEGKVYEGTGLYGRSSLRRVDLQTGNVELKRDFEQHIFAEGITIYEDKLYQLTWENHIIFQLDKNDFSTVGAWNFPHQGWGITHDNERLIVSDGTATLYFLDPTTLVEAHRIWVHDHRGPVNRLNELEYIDGKIYANIWKSDQIAIIDPEDGVVTGYLDLSGLSSRLENGKRPGVLNGIMYDPRGGRLFVTGKLWPALFEITLIPVPR